jgi:hypothetical protein
MISTRSFRPASIECVPVSVVEVESDIQINRAFAAASTDEPIDSSIPIADKEMPQPAEPAERSRDCRSRISPLESDPIIQAPHVTSSAVES